MKSFRPGKLVRIRNFENTVCLIVKSHASYHDLLMRDGSFQTWLDIWLEEIK